MIRRPYLKREGKAGRPARPALFRSWRLLFTPQLVVSLVAALTALYGLWPRPVTEAPARIPVIADVTRSRLPLVVHPLPTRDGPDCALVACLALSFDDGPDAAVTPRLLDILDKYHAQATFFVLGNRVVRYPAIIQRMYREGFEIGNHSWDHADLTKLTAPQIAEEVSRTQDAVLAAGAPEPVAFRPPYGALNTTVRQSVPLALTLWNIDPKDWDAKTSQQIIDRVLANARPGRVVDFHDTHALTAEALDKLIPQLQQQGYQLVTVSQMFGLDPGDRGEFYGR